MKGGSDPPHPRLAGSRRMIGLPTERGRTCWRARTTIEAWLAVLPVQSADDSDLVLALEAVHAHRLPFWDAMLWASAQCAGVRHMLSEDFQDGFELQHIYQPVQS